MYRDQIASIQRSWQSWLDALGAFDDEQLAEPATCGKWSVRDVMSHFAVWDSIAIETIVGIVSGEHRDTLESVQEINDRAIIEARDRSVVDVRPHMMQVHDELISSMDAQMATPIETLERIEAAIGEPTWRHYNEHTDELRVLAASVP